MEPRVPHISVPDENSDAEAANGTLKRAHHQQLLLRGNCDFSSAEVYEQFVLQVRQRHNQPRQTCLAEETTAMQRVTQPPIAADHCPCMLFQMPQSGDRGIETRR